MRHYLCFGIATILVTGSGRARAEEPTSDDKSKLSKLEIENAQLKTDIKNRDDAEASKRFIRYGVTVGAAYSIYTPFPNKTRLEAVQGGSVLGYLGAFPAYWFMPASQAAYCAANWSASEEGARAAEALAGGQSSEATVEKALVSGQEALRSKADGLKKDAEVKKDQILAALDKLAPRCKERSTQRTLPQKTSKAEDWIKFCSASVPVLDPKKWDPAKPEENKKSLLDGYCFNAEAAAKADVDGAKKLCQMDQPTADSIVALMKDPLKEESQLLDQAAKAESEVKTLDQVEKGASLKTDYQQRLKRKQLVALRDTYQGIVESEWLSVRVACDFTKNFDFAWAQDHDQPTVVKRCKNKIDKSNNAKQEIEKAQAAYDKSRLQADSDKKGWDSQLLQRESKALASAKADLESARKAQKPSDPAVSPDVAKAEIAVKDARARVDGAENIERRVKDSTREAEEQAKNLQKVKDSAEQLAKEAPEELIGEFFEDLERYVRYSDLVVSSWSPAEYKDCLLTKLGVYFGVAAPFNATVVLPDDPSTTLKIREVGPSVNFGLALAPNALITILTGPMVGQVKRDDGTSAPIWAWTIGFGGTIDVVNMFRR